MPVIDKHITPLDYAILQNGSITALMAVCMANDASITDDLVPGTVWTEVEGQYDQVEVRFQEITPAAEESMVKKHQTIVDFVCQNAGEISGLFTTALLNGLSITQEVAEGAVLKVAQTQLKVINYFKTNGIDIVSSRSSSDTMSGGIGYMQIGSSFIVS